MYPYTAAGTHLQQLTPEWLQEGSVDKMLKRLRHSPTRKRAVEDTAKGYFKGLPLEWDKLVIAFVNTEANQYAIGKSIAEIASARNMSGEETMLALIDEEDNNVGVVIHNRKEIDVRFFLSHPQAMIGSDGNAISPTGVYGRERPHPRFYGTYPRILGRYVREKPSILTLEEAVYKMSGFPAERMRFKNRGTIAKGHIADIVIFDPNTVIDRATFKDPHQYPTGIPYVLVNGELVVSKGKHTGARPGKVLRRGV
jgi:N-acyl-D-aspartate/D-glutamate deacylase